MDENHPLAKDPIHYWMSQRSTYPRLAKMAFDILTIPASSADCKMMFSELGDLLEVRRMKPLEGKQAEQIPVITWVGNSCHVLMNDYDMKIPSTYLSNRMEG